MIMTVIMITFENLALCEEYLPQICVVVFFVLGLHRVFLGLSVSLSLMQTHTLTDADSGRTFGARLLAHGK